MNDKRIHLVEIAQESLVQKSLNILDTLLDTSISDLMHFDGYQLKAKPFEEIGAARVAISKVSWKKGEGVNMEMVDPLSAIALGLKASGIVSNEESKAVVR